MQKDVLKSERAFSFSEVGIFSGNWNRKFIRNLSEKCISNNYYCHFLFPASLLEFSFGENLRL
jgi:hypothetical protein